MLTACAALLIFPAGVQGPTPGELVSRMLARYYEAQSLTGKIVFTQSAAGRSVEGLTVVQFERPAKIYIHQTLPSPEPRSSLLVSDGELFSYDVPQSFSEDDRGVRLREGVKRQGESFDVRRIYGIATLSLLDRSAILDIAIGRREDLAFLRNQWATLEHQGTETIAGKQAYLVGGQWREYGRAPVSGTYQMAITEEGEILRFALRETVALGELPNVPPQVITSIWTADLKINGKPDPALFVVK